MSKTLSIGRIVHYVLDEHLDEHRPAIVVDVFSDTLCNLQVFTDGLKDRLPNVMWQLDVWQDENFKDHGTWHWPEGEDT